MGNFMGPFENSWGFDSIFMEAKFGSVMTCLHVEAILWNSGFSPGKRNVCMSILQEGNAKFYHKRMQRVI